MEKFRKGDVVSVQGTISAIHAGEAYLDVDGVKTIYIPLPNLTLVRPVFEVGDFVHFCRHPGTDKETNEYGTVRAIHGTDLWCQDSRDRGMATWDAARCERIDEIKAGDLSPSDE